MTNAKDYAMVFRAAESGAIKTAWQPGHGSTGDYRDMAKAMAGAFGGIAAVFEGIAKVEENQTNKSESAE